MNLVALGLIVLCGLVWLGRRQTRSTFDRRLLRAVFSALAALGAVVCGLRGIWPGSLLLLALVAWLAAKDSAVGSPPRADGGGDITAREALAVLGLADGAGRAEIVATYRRLMRRAHPDHGGTPGLAARLNAARDRLLRAGRGSDVLSRD